jgi:hypothetical protein
MIDFNLVAANGSIETRAFKNAGVATRYANKHGLTVAKSVGALALIETVDQSLEAVDAVDVDAVLASINVTGDTDTATLRERALAVAQSDVDAMVERIRATFDARDAFEESRGLDLADRSTSYAVARKRMLDAGQAVARAFIVLGAEPVNVIRRKVVSSNEFTAKGLDKVTELCQFICGNEVRFQSVTKAFIACAIAVADRDDSAIGNKVNKAFLSNASFDRLVSDADLATYLKDYQHKFMSGGRDTQSSQVRNVLDVLGLADIVTVDRARGGIAIKRDHGFYDLFRNRFMQTA